MQLIFDVDGTLTPSRGEMDSKFQQWFNGLCRKYPVHLVTGSDKPKTIEQIGKDTFNLCFTVYNCSGADVWQSNKQIRFDNWVLPADAEEFLQAELKNSKFVLRTGLHIEHRTGMVNFSIVGRNATLGERKLYKQFDNQFNERIAIAKRFKTEFPQIDARPGGETGIDIFPVGKDKSRILDDFNGNNLHFFGDRMDKAGNDYPLAQKIIDNGRGYCYYVKDWTDTWKELQLLCPDV